MRTKDTSAEEKRNRERPEGFRQIHRQRASRNKDRDSRRSVVAFVVAMVVVVLAAIQFLTTLHTFLGTQSQLHSLQAQQSELQSQKSDLDQKIKRWSDRDYIINQAREQLGLSFPGETNVELEGVNVDGQPEKKVDLDASSLQGSQQALLFGVESLTGQSGTSTNNAGVWCLNRLMEIFTEGSGE
ncbi:MAG: septum formation initiator family protein [Aeriscardovia sp.]|nr:septum formation initiator family protein [Aeriscardovia sp.]